MTGRFLIISFWLICSCLCDSTHRIKTRWEYEEQHNWPQSCRGQFQSPIDLPDICYPKQGSRVAIDSSMNYNPQGFNQLLPYKRMRILNNGHTVSVTVDGWDYISDDVPSISVNVERGRIEYQFYELHFHWAQDNTQGSEHSIAGSRKALEMHLVHFNKKYRNKDIASSQSDGLLVLGVLFHEDTMVNPTLDPIIDQLQYVRKTNYSAPARKSFTLQSLLPPDTSVYFMYKGSLTTPPCSESVTWLIIAEVQSVGYSQLREFQTKESSGDRNRDIQDRNGRPIYANSNAHCSMDSDYGPDKRPGTSGGYNPDNGSGSGSGDSSSPVWSDRPQGQGGSGYGSGRPGTGSESWASGRPQTGSGYGYEDSSYRPPYSGRYRPQGPRLSGSDVVKPQQAPVYGSRGNSGRGHDGSHRQNFYRNAQEMTSRNKEVTLTTTPP